MDWAEAIYEVDFFKKCLVLGWSFFAHHRSLLAHHRSLMAHQRSPSRGPFSTILGGVLENGTFAENLKKCEDENDADGI